MTADNAAANARAEAARGDESLASARCLVDNGFPRDAVSRAYYAAYHWARALLLSKGVEPKTHRGTVQLFSLHFVKDGPLADDVAALLARLETYRELSDYTSTASFSDAQAQAEVGRAELFIQACRPFVP